MKTAVLNIHKKDTVDEIKDICAEQIYRDYFWLGLFTTTNTMVYTCKYMFFTYETMSFGLELLHIEVKRLFWDSETLDCKLVGKFKGSPDKSHFIFEINVGKRRIRHRTTLNFIDSYNRF